jgi:hypothetical protein
MLFSKSATKYLIPTSPPHPKSRDPRHWGGDRYLGLLFQNRLKMRVLFTLFGKEPERFLLYYHQ